MVIAAQSNRRAVGAFAAIALALAALASVSFDSAAARDRKAVTATFIPGDRRIDWSLAGIPGGIPKRTRIATTLDANRFGNGVSDATAAIQAAIDRCPAGQVVVLPAGDFVTSATIHLRSNTTLRGAGLGKTILRYQGSAGRSVLDIRGGAYHDLWERKRTYDVVGEVRKDSRRIRLIAIGETTVGDILLVDQLNDGRLVDNLGSEGLCTYCSREDGKRARGEFAQVTAVDGNTVTLNLPIFFGLDPALKPQATLIDGKSMVRWAGAEDLSITQSRPVTEFIVEMDGAQYCWLKNVEVSRINRRGLWHIDSLQNEFRGCYFHDAIAGFGRDHGYGLQLDLQSTANLVEDNMFQTIDGGGIMTSGGAVGNVIAYNFLTNIQFDEPHWMIAGPVLNHSPHPSMNLWEGNVGPQIGNDFIHGSSSHNTVFRCRSTGYRDPVATANNNTVELQYKNSFSTVVGCVLGTAGQTTVYEVVYPAVSTAKTVWRLGFGGPQGRGDPNPQATLLRHGNWDCVTNDVVWDPHIADHKLPPSLYRTGRPVWWNRSPWPPIGPDVTGLANKIPAQQRYERMAADGRSDSAHTP